MKKKIDIKSIIDYILVILLLILSISKGGFYKSDTLVFSIGIILLGFIRIIIDLYKTIQNKKYEFDVIEILLLILTLAYILPIIFRNYADLNNSIFESIRYFNLFLIYYIVKKSSNKNIFLYTIVGITLFQCLLSVDGVGNRYFEDILKKIDSGYLDRDFNRMSGTFQYANTLAILCLVSVVLVNKYLLKEKRVLKYVIIYICQFILLTVVILTGTRTVLIMAIISFVFLFFINIEENIKKILTYIPMIIVTLIYSSIAYSNMMSSKIYYIFIK